MPKEVPAALTEDQLKFWLANSHLTRDQLKSWYASFYEFSNKNQNMNKEQFVNLFSQLQGKHDGDEFLKLAFKGGLLVWSLVKENKLNFF